MWQVKSEREKKYSEEAFWLRTVSFRENFTEDKFSNLFEVQAAIHKIYSLALENNLGQDIIAEWQQHVIVVQSLLDSLGTKSHRTAMKDLKKKSLEETGLKSGQQKMMDSILRNSQREEPVIQQVVQAQGYRQGPQFGLPGPYQNRSLWAVWTLCKGLVLVKF